MALMSMVFLLVDLKLKLCKSKHIESVLMKARRGFGDPKQTLPNISTRELKIRELALRQHFTVYPTLSCVHGKNMFASEMHGLQKRTETSKAWRMCLDVLVFMATRLCL